MVVADATLASRTGGGLSEAFVVLSEGLFGMYCQLGSTRPADF